jgi:tetratricopeptide (TPR) repeat protein
MKRLLFILALIFSGCAALTPLQRSKFITVSHMIETAKYAEAKEIIEEMISNEETSQWPRTWYSRGVLCQTAYREGIRRNNRRHYELYPDQLYVAFDSFEKAAELDTKGRLDKQMKPKYILLANDFQALGERSFKEKKYNEALKAFEHALEITERSGLALQADTNLLYNAALAAYESNNPDRAIKHLSRLHAYKYSTNVAHLLFKSHLGKGNAIAAQKVLREGIDNYDDNQELVLLLADLYVKAKDFDGALILLDESIAADSANHIYYHTKGLIYQKLGRYDEAIPAYFEAINHNPEDVMAHFHIATCYYNIGVEIEENARAITNNRLVLEEKEKSAAAFEAAFTWLNKTYRKKPGDQNITDKMDQLFNMLRITDRVRSMDDQVN